MNGASDVSQKDPMRIYVLWHADCLRGKEYAQEIYKWFRGDPSDISQCGHGIHVEYRSYPLKSTFKQSAVAYQGEQQGGILNGTSETEEIIREIKVDQADINVIVPLIDEHMVVDRKWRDYLSSLVPDNSDIQDNSNVSPNSNAPRNSNCLICPIALHSAAYQLPENIIRLNFLRLDRANDPNTWDEKQLLEARRERLLRLLTEVCCRLLWRENRNNRQNITSATNTQEIIDRNLPAAPIKVFISHAKVDGTDIAQSIREQIYQYGQLQAFFDESDLAIGYAWEEELKQSANHSTTAMIAVFTDAYASRPWCRQEIRLAREPRESQSQCWHVKPLLVVDALSNGASSFLPEFGYAPVIRWNPDQVPLLIDQLLREILVHGYNEKRAKLLSSRKGQHHYLNCVPDLQTVLKIRQEPTGHSEIKRLVIPPPGLSGIEEEMLKGLLQMGEGSQIMTFDQVTELDDQDNSLLQQPHPLEEKLIAISISDSPDLIHYGYDLNHLHELTINISRMVLRLGGNLAYGGDLRPSGFTETLFSLARSEQTQNGKRSKQTQNGNWKRRLYNFLAWPYYHDLSPSDEAQLINTCCFVRVTPTDAGLEETVDRKITFDTPETAYQRIRCLSKMRDLMTKGDACCFGSDKQETPPLSARILVAGKTQDFVGIIPGLFEEYLLAAENDVPTYILGGFGGAARILANALTTQNNPEDVLSHEDYKGKFASLLAKKYQRSSAEQYKPYPKGPYPGQLYERLNACLKRTSGNDLLPLKNGLTAEENKKLMSTPNSAIILSLLRKGLMNISTEGSTHTEPSQSS